MSVQREQWQRREAREQNVFWRLFFNNSQVAMRDIESAVREYYYEAPLGMGHWAQCEYCCRVSYTRESRCAGCGAPLKPDSIIVCDPRLLDVRQFKNRPGSVVNLNLDAR